MDQKQGVSRRSFLKGVGAGALAAGAISGLARDGEAQDTPADIAGPGPTSVTLQINGMSHSVEVEPRVTLLDALRNHLDITGSKKVCDRGACGACTVLLEGQAVNACSMLAIAAQGRKIETIESMARGDELSPLQEAFIEHDALQCGFCTSGFIMASEALLRRQKDPSDQDICDGLSGNLCRCGTYCGIHKAVAQAAKGAR